MPVTSEKLKPRYHGERVTREEYLDLPDDGFKYDMIEGVLFMAPSPNFDHNDVNGAFTHLIRSALAKHKIGRVAPETDLFLPDGDDVLRPDICFILNENTQIIKTHIHGVPDLVCEILSPATRKRDLSIKADRYLKSGVKEYWILDPEEKEIHLWLNRQGKWEKHAGDHLTSTLIPGFEADKSSIFP